MFHVKHLKPFLFALGLSFELGIRHAAFPKLRLRVERILVRLIQAAKAPERESPDLLVGRKPQARPPDEVIPREVDGRVVIEDYVFVVDYAFFESSAVESIAVCLTLSVTDSSPTSVRIRATFLWVSGFSSVPLSSLSMSMPSLII